MAQCRCELAGWCETHKRKMSHARFLQCKNEPGYFDVFAKDHEKREKPSVGLGDVVDAVTTLTGVKGIVNTITGGCGGCEKRREEWNNVRI